MLLGFRLVTAQLIVVFFFGNNMGIYGLIPLILVKVLHIALKNTLLAWGWLQAIYSTIPSFFKRLSFRSRNWCRIWDRHSHVDVQYCTALYTIQLGTGKSKKIDIHFWSLMLKMSCFHVIPLKILWNPPLISSSGCFWFFPHPKYGRFPCHIRPSKGLRNPATSLGDGCRSCHPSEDVQLAPIFSTQLDDLDDLSGSR